MLSAVLAAHVVCGVSLYLQPQDAVSDIAWPTRAVATLPKGWVKQSDHLFVLENGRPIAAQVEIVGKWADGGSPKWVHVYAPFRYVAGKPARYELEKKNPLPELPKSPLTVADNPREIVIDTGVITISIPRPFVGVASIKQGKTVLLNGPGGPSLLDARGLTWVPRFDPSAELIVEQQGPAQVTVRATGWYQTEDKRAEPFCRYVTRITACANSPMVKFDHAAIFADDMRKNAVAEMPFKFAIPNATAYSSGSERGTFDEKLKTAWFAQLSANELVSLTETDTHTARAPKVAGKGRRSPGWFAADVQDRRVVLLTKDFWQKCPKEVEIGPDRMIYYAWPRHGALASTNETATKLDSVYKFDCFQTGALLDSRLPSDYFTALLNQRDSTECKAEYARAANLSGVAMHNEFALVVLPASSGTDSAAGNPAKLARLYFQDPIARVSPEAVAQSGVFGPVAAAGSDFAPLHQVARDAMLGYARSIERYGDYGWAIYGNTHHEELMNPAAAGVPAGRPSLHRVWNNNHYQHVSTSWRLAALQGDPRLWDWARLCSDNYASIGQVRYDKMKGHLDGKDDLHPGPEVKFHRPGAMWHCKAFVPWGGRDYGMDSNDEDANLTGHWPDPSGLLLAWLLDGNRWAKDGYDLWRRSVKFPNRGTRREVNTTLVHAITAYEYEPDEIAQLAIKGMAESMRSVPITEQHPGPIWEPTWLSRYYEHAPDDEAFKKYVVASADAIAVGSEGIWSLALSATAYQITKDDEYLKRHAGQLARATRQLFHDPDPDKRWDKYGFGPGPDRDHHFLMQWPRFAYALREAKIDSLPVPDEPGQYFCGPSRYDNITDVASRGTRILTWRTSDEPFQVAVQAMTLSSGDVQPTSLEVLPPRGSALLSVTRLPMSAATPVVRTVTRPSSWEVATETYKVPQSEPGLHTIRIGSNQVGVFQGLTTDPECQVLINSKPRNGDPVSLCAKFTRGYLVPLVNSRIELTFTAEGVSDGSHIVLKSAKGQTVLDQYLRAGSSASVTLNDRAAPPGPWLLDAYSDHTGWFRLTIQCDADEPLLYGRKLEDIELIRQKLGRSAPAAREVERANPSARRKRQ
jgi:hypothetical protein